MMKKLFLGLLIAFLAGFFAYLLKCRVEQEDA